jgi:hypothetical protein
MIEEIDLTMEGDGRQATSNTNQSNMGGDTSVNSLFMPLASPASSARHCNNVYDRDDGFSTLRYVQHYLNCHTC